MNNRRLILGFVLSFALCFTAGQKISQGEEINADICVYGGTASGVCAALAAARRGNSVIVVAPFRHPGGMHGGGIRLKQDCLYLRDIGGIAKELHEEDMAMAGNGSSNQWQARRMIKKKLDEAGIKLVTEHRIELCKSSHRGAVLLKPGRHVDNSDN